MELTGMNIQEATFSKESLDILNLSGWKYWTVLSTFILILVSGSFFKTLILHFILHCAPQGRPINVLIAFD